MGNIDKHGNKIYAELPDSIPNELLNEDWAKYIHDQTLKRLNERGGLSIMEIIMNLKRWRLDHLINTYGYNYKATKKDADELLLLLNQNNNP